MGTKLGLGFKENDLGEKVSEKTMGCSNSVLRKPWYIVKSKHNVLVSTPNILLFVHITPQLLNCEKQTHLLF